MVLIKAKQMDDERRMKRSSSSETSEARSKPAELRWKWVEDYCWRNGCLRSQNQCNDKWDNLMRDYKKVRDHERKLSSSPDHHNEVSYWRMEKNERKEKNLPSNMLLQIYEALVEVVDKKRAGQRVVAGVGSSSASAAGGGLAGSNPNIGFVMERPITMVQPAAPMLHQLPAPIPVLQQPLPLPPPSLQPPPPPQPRPDSSDSDTSEYSGSPAKRRRRGGNGDHRQGTSAGGTASASNSQELGTAISKSASLIAEALHACEEREERRHRDLVSLHEKRLRIEESKSEFNRQGINGLVDAINKLANSILALASSNKNQESGPK